MPSDAQLDGGMDWQQVRMNGGPPCFHADADGSLCGRAKWWDGHEDLHKYVSLAEYVRTLRAQTLREVAQQAEDRGHVHFAEMLRAQAEEQRS